MGPKSYKLTAYFWIYAINHILEWQSKNNIILSIMLIEFKMEEKREHRLISTSTLDKFRKENIFNIEINYHLIQNSNVHSTSRIFSKAFTCYTIACIVKDIHLVQVTAN